MGIDIYNNWTAWVSSMVIIHSTSNVNVSYLEKIADAATFT